MELINEEVAMVDIIVVIVIIMNVIIVHEVRIVMVPRVSKDVIVVVVGFRLRALEESSLLWFQFLRLTLAKFSFHPFPMEPLPPLRSFHVPFSFWVCPLLSQRPLPGTQGLTPLFHHFLPGGANGCLCCPVGASGCLCCPLTWTHLKILSIALYDMSADIEATFVDDRIVGVQCMECAEEDHQR